MIIYLTYKLRIFVNLVLISCQKGSNKMVYTKSRFVSQLVKTRREQSFSMFK